jgi:hypothetical protein
MSKVDYKVGDLIYSEGDGPRTTADIAEILKITDDRVTYSWVGLNGMPKYVFSMHKNEFEAILRKGDTFKIIPCDSKNQKLAWIIKNG